MEQENCALCRAGNYGAAFTKDCILGRKTPLLIAQQFPPMTEADVMEHINKHQLVINEETGEYSSPDYYLNKLAKLMKQLDAWMKYSIELAPSHENVKLGLQVTKEIRGTLDQLAEMQGRKDSGRNVNVQIENMNVRYQQLTNIILQEVCGDCRSRIIKSLDAQMTVSLPETKDCLAETAWSGSEQLQKQSQIQSGS
jgi:hypothetical protein